MASLCKSNINNINININIHQLNNEEENNKKYVEDYFEENNQIKEMSKEYIDVK